MGDRQYPKRSRYWSRYESIVWVHTRDLRAVNKTKSAEGEVTPRGRPRNPLYLQLARSVAYKKFQTWRKAVAKLREAEKQFDRAIETCKLVEGSRGFSSAEVQRLWPSRKSGRPPAQYARIRINRLTSIFLSEKRNDHYANMRPILDYLDQRVPPHILRLKKGVKHTKFASETKIAMKNARVEIQKENFSSVDRIKMRKNLASWTKRGRPRSINAD